MANALDAFNPEIRSRRIQERIRRTATFMALANMEERASLQKGDVVHRPYTSDFVVNDYTKGTDVTIQDVTATDETLTVDQTKEVSFYIDQIDSEQNLYNAYDDYGSQAAFRLADEMDKTYYKEVENATYDFDDGNIGGTDGNPITLTTSNTIKTFSLLMAKMKQEDIEGDREWCVTVDPVSVAFMEQETIAQGFNRADSFLNNGYTGNFLGFKIYESNNLLHETVLTSTGNVSADDTLTVGGVVFTFKAAPAVAGEVDLGANAATSIDNLAAAINGGAGAGTAYIEVSTADRNTLSRNKVVATETDTTLTIKTSGNVTVVESLANVTAGTTTVKSLAQRKGAIDMVIQKMPTAQKNKAPLKTGYNIITFDLYGIKTFKEGRDRMVELNLAAQ